MSDPRPIARAKGWRKSHADLKPAAEELATYLDEHESMTTSLQVRGMTPADIVRRLVHLLDSAEGNVRAEEKHAWDMFAAAWRETRVLPAGGTAPDMAARYADDLLALRRARFAKEEA